MNEVENHYKKLKIKIIKVQEGFKYNSGENSHFLSIKEIRDLYSDYLKNF
jgi:hypothetical protein